MNETPHPIAARPSSDRGRLLRSVLLAYALLLTFADARADADADRIGRDVAHAAAMAYAREAAAKAIDAQVRASASATTGAATTSAGTRVVAMVDLAFAMKDYQRARTGEQRTEAGARAAVAVYALAGGPAAPVIAGVLAIRQLVYAVGDAQLAKELAEIYKRREEHLKRIFEIKKELATADYYWLSAMYFRVLGLSSDIDRITSSLAAKCSDVGHIASSEDLDRCLIDYSDLILSMESLIATAHQFLGYTGSVLSADHLLIVTDSDGASRPFRITRQALEENISQYQESLSKHKEYYQSVLSSYTDALSKIFSSKVADRPAMTDYELNRDRCINQLVEADLTGSSLLVRWIAPPNDAQLALLTSLTEEHLQRLEQLEHLPCAAYANNAADPRASLLLEAIHQTRELKRLLRAKYPGR